MKLTDFFNPLNFQSLVQYILLFLFFDILGTYAKRYLLKPSESDSTRIINWLIGLGLFVFIWFMISLGVPYTANNILISIGVLTFVSTPYYIKSQAFKSLASDVLRLKLPILLIVPFLPAVFVKSSLPPYYGDEMAYHFISPYSVMHLEALKYRGGLYADLPRLMNMFYEIIFSLTKTYSIARLFHFTILTSSMLYAYKVLSKRFGWITGFLFVLLFFSLPQDIVLTSTLGYIDVAAYSFLLIAIVSGVSYIIKPENEYLILSVVFWALNLGTKYTGISSFVFFALSLIIILIISKQIKSLINIKNMTLLLVTFLIFGGYWYIKNIILYGNPIFPFLFDCWGSHIEQCPQSGTFFGDWTTKINIENLYLILSQLFSKNKIIQLLVLVTPFLSYFINDKKIKTVVYFMYATVFMDLIFLKYFSGFYVRYHQHMQLYLLIGLCLTLLYKYQNRILYSITRLILVLLTLYSSVFYIYNVNYSNSLKFLNWNEINYSIGRININEWIDLYFPSMKYTIRWCEDGDLLSPKYLARYDPDLIWFDYDGLSRSFMLNCEYVNPIPENIPISEVISYAIKNKLVFYISSPNKCTDDNNVVPKFSYERPYQTTLRKLNVKIICNSKEIEPNLYYFDYKTLKP